MSILDFTAVTEPMTLNKMEASLPHLPCISDVEVVWMRPHQLEEYRDALMQLISWHSPPLGQGWGRLFAGAPIIVIKEGQRA